jgi:hypothetical protein
METGAISTASPATHCRVWSGFPRDVGMGRKSRHFAHSLPSLGSRFARFELEIAESHPALSAKIPVLRRLSAETSSITTATRSRQSIQALSQA